MPEFDTIAALSTPAGESAVALIRLSGPACPELGRRLLNRKKLLRPRFAHFGTYRDRSGREIDDCVVTFFEEGKSFTGEAMLEIAPHGNPLLVQTILEDLLARGCRAAGPGEFTRTAFLNGRMDLSQAEAVADLIRARSDQGLEVARRQLHGALGRKINGLTDRLLGIIAQIEAYIDFPEEDLPGEDQAGPARDLRGLIGEIGELIETRHYAALLREGVKTLIVGEPNVGKSSLMNALTGSERAIVSGEPGTTRDFLSAPQMIGPWKIELLDTAGIRPDGGEIERKGIAHTMEQAETADFFLLVLDATKDSPEIPDTLKERMEETNTIVLENKIDLVDTPRHGGFLPGVAHAPVSLLRNQGLDAFREMWLERIGRGVPGADAAADGVAVNARHAAALGEARDALSEASAKLRAGEFSELVAADLREAVDAVGKVVGKIDNERMLDSLFRQFCIGK